MEKLHKEQEQLTHSLMQARRNEQQDLERVRRDYNIRINSIENRQAVISKELKDYERGLERLERLIKEEKEQADDAPPQGHHASLHRRLR